MLPALLALSLNLTQGPLESSVEDETAGAEASSTPASIYRISWPLDVAITVGATTAIVVPYALSNQLITPRCPCDAGEVNSFDRGAIGNHSQAADVASDVTVGLVWVAPLVVDVFDVGWSGPLLEDAVVFAEVLAVNGALVAAAKYIVQRPLPRTYAGDPGLLTSPAGYRSFYSGHTSNVMASLTFLAMTLRLRHGEKWWPWVVALLVGTSVGIERVLAGRHFPTDVMTGGLAGSAVGILVPWLHSKSSPTGGGLSFLPLRDGAQLGWSFRW